MKDCLARRLKEARLALGISQRKLGMLAGIDEYSAAVRVSQYEMGKYIPNPLTLSRIATILDHPVEFFFSEDDKMAEVIYLVGRLPEPVRSKLLDKVKTWILEYEDSFSLAER